MLLNPDGLLKLFQYRFPYTDCVTTYYQLFGLLGKFILKRNFPFQKRPNLNSNTSGRPYFQQLTGN